MRVNGHIEPGAFRAQLAAYQDELSCKPVDAVVKACLDWPRTSQWWPSLNELLTAVDAATAATEQRLRISGSSDAEWAQLSWPMNWYFGQCLKAHVTVDEARDAFRATLRGTNTDALRHSIQRLHDDGIDGKRSVEAMLPVHRKDARPEPHPPLEESVAILEANPHWPGSAALQRLGKAMIERRDENVRTAA